MGFIDDIVIADVVDCKTWGGFAQQTCGTPYPTFKYVAKATKRVKEMFELYPNADWQTMARVAIWARAKKRRFATLYGLASSWRYAWKDGFLPELDAPTHVDEETEAAIAKALLTETSPIWRERLIAAEGKKARRQIYEAWSIKLDPDSTVMTVRQSGG